MGRNFAFVDESGDTSIEFEKAGVSRRYVLAAVLVDDVSIEGVEQAVKRISDNYFSGAELKSSKVGNNQKRREKILLELAAVNFKYYAYVVDKANIYKESGLKYKKSFYKYLNGSLFNRLCRSKEKIKIHVDKHGRSDFMSSFEKYLEKKYDYPLLLPEIFEYVDSRERCLVQVADFVAGTIARYLDGKDDVNLLEILNSNELYTYKWPPSVSKADDFSKLEETEKYDQIIREQSVKQAKDYIYNYIGSLDVETQLKVKILEYLLHRFLLDPGEYVFSDEIIEQLSEVGFQDIKSQTLRSGVVAPLRDAGVVIASCNKGYKIPNGVSDMQQFVKTVDGVVVPYINRLSEAREIMLIASRGAYDIVSSEEYPKLKSFLDSSKYD